MPVAPQKIVQAMIQATLRVDDLVQQANTLAQVYKTRYQQINPDLSGTNLTRQQLSDLNQYITDLQILSQNSLVATIKANKNHHSHGVRLLD